VGIPYYVIIDIRYRKRGVNRELKGYRLTPTGYIPLLPNEQGWLWLERVGAWLGVTDGAVVCYDRDGQRLENYARLAKAKKQAEARVAELEARLRELEEEQRRQQTKNQESSSSD
jgi:hypothetical protein